MRQHGFLRYIHIKHIVLPILFIFAYACYSYVFGATITSYSDRISDSGPGAYANHDVNFTTTVPIPPGGFIRFSLEDGEFEIPASDFDIDNVALYVATSSGFQLRSATGTPSATDDGVTIVTGTSGYVEVTLNSTVGIPANADIRLLIGNETPLAATSTDLGILNPGAIGTKSYYITAGDGVTNSSVTGLLALVEHVTVGDVDTTETIPPFRFNGAPTGVLSGTTQIVQMSLETNEFSRCRYTSTPNTSYFSIGSEFGTSFTTVHMKNIAVSAATTSSTTYSFYVRCIDDEGNVNTDDYEITFTLLRIPTGTPGEEGDNEGGGTGGGEGTGDADDGAGDPTGDDDESGGSSGGGGGGGSGGGSGSSSGGSEGSGGFEGTDKPYQSGDGRVIITGYAFPRSDIVILVDGQIADTVESSATGEFSSTLDQIARGAYSFGVYGIDRNGVKSSTFSTTFTVTGSRGSTLSNINVMPSIKVTPDPVDPNSTVRMSGYAIPNATVTIENQNDKSSVSLKTFTATSDSNGAWSVDISTSGFTTGTYKVRAKAKQDAGAISTNFSNYTFYGVGQPASVPRSSDLNRDGKVNLTDFSILLFWWNSDGGASNPPADINGDGRVSLTDFSIMIFNWTG